MRRARARAVGAAILGVSVTLGMAVAGCGVGVSHTLDASSAARTISTHLAAQYGIPPPAVDCPSGVQLVVGRTFTCSTVLEGQSLQVHGKLTDSAGHFDVTLGEAVLIAAKAASTLASRISVQAGAKATVDCGSRAVLVVAPGSSFTCRGTVGGQPRNVVVTVKDLTGDVSYSLLPPTSGAGAEVTVPGA